MNIGAVIMLGAEAHSAPEQLMLDAQRSATLDLIDLLQAQFGITPILSSPDLSWLPQSFGGILEQDPPGLPFHFGQRLAEILQKHAVEHTFYFGGASAPLLDVQQMEMIVGILETAARGIGTRIPSHIGLTNNRHSSDWLGITYVSDALEAIRSAQRDNSLAWALQETERYEVRELGSLRPATMMDLDTPSDLAIIRQHPECLPNLHAMIQDPLLDAVPVTQLLSILEMHGVQVALVGRVAPLAWQALSKNTHCWIRVYSEERGMVGSERLVRGEVRSLLGMLLEAQGPKAFFESLGELCNAAIIDSRVLMAHHYGSLPSQADRFASDLFLVDQISDPWLRDFTIAARNAPMPIILGGHNVVAGGLFALTEIIGGRYFAKGS